MAGGVGANEPVEDLTSLFIAAESMDSNGNPQALGLFIEGMKLRTPIVFLCAWAASIPPTSPSFVTARLSSLTASAGC